MNLGSTLPNRHPENCKEGKTCDITRGALWPRPVTRCRRDAAAKKPVRTVLSGRQSILKVRIYDDFGEDGFEVSIQPAPGLDPSVPRSFTAKRGQYLGFIFHYTKIHGVAPSESDMQVYLR